MNENKPSPKKNVEHKGYNLLFYYGGKREGYDLYLPRPFRWALIIYLIVALWTSWFIVDKDENAVIQRFGKHIRSAEPGFNGKAPWPFEYATEVQVKKVKNLEIGFRTIDEGPPAQYEDVESEALMLTGDANIVDLDFIIQYRPGNAADWLFKMEDPVAALMLLAQSSMRFTVGQSTFDSVATYGRNKIQMDVRDGLDKLNKELNYGPVLAGVQLQDVHPPADVMGAFKDVTNAREEKERMIRTAEGYQNGALPRAQGDARKMIEDALGYESERVQIARGDSARFVDVLKEYKKQPDITRTRLRLEALNKILPNTNQWIIVPEGGPLQFMNLTPQGGN